MTSQPKFRTPDGVFQVQAMSVDGKAQYRVTENGMVRTIPDRKGRRNGRNPFTIEELATLVPVGELEEIS